MIIIDNAKKCEKGMMISSILTLILGIILLIEPTGSLRMLTSIIAIVAMIVGFFQLVDYIRKPRELKMMSLSLILGVFFLASGLFLLLNVDSLVKFVTLVIGVSIAIKAMFKIQFALNLRGISDKWKYNLIVGLLCMTLGVLLIFNPFKSAVLFLRIIGIVLAVGSIIELIETNMVLHTLDDVKELPFVEKNKKDV